MKDQAMNSIIERFNRLPWHDSGLLGLSIYRTGGDLRAHEVRMSVLMWEKEWDPQNRLVPRDIVFKDCAYLAADVFLLCKEMCSDAISHALCYETSDWKETVSQPSPMDPHQGGRGLEPFLHFSIDLCPPSGTIDILAMDFTLKATRP